MIFPIYQVIFYVFAAMLIISAVLTICVRNPVHAVLFLVASFFASSVLWMLLQAEFLSLVLIFVYVGAVMTLFLFVVMMLNIDITVLKKKFVRFLPLGIIVMLLLVGMLVFVFSPKHYSQANAAMTHFGPGYSNTKTIGMLLYTEYLFPFEIAAMLLFVAIIAAISLSFHGRKTDTKSQKMSQQHLANKASRLRVISLLENEKHDSV